MRSRKPIGAFVTATFIASTLALSAQQTPSVRPMEETRLREYTGTYSWGPNAFIYLQMWEEFTGFGKPRELLAFDESGDVRTLYPYDVDKFFAGPGMAISTSVESRIEVQRDNTGKIASLTWQRDGTAPRTARRVEIEKRENVRFSNGDIQLAGTLISPATSGKHPAIVLVHGSGDENREYVLPWARFLIRRGVAVLGYDKRGVGESTGDWHTASFEDLAGDVVSAFEYLKTRSDVDREHIGLLGVSQAGWVMPLAANRAEDIAFLISISGAGIPPSDTTLDQARNEMTMGGMPSQTVDEIIALLKLQYEFARTGKGWDEYAAARTKLATRMGAPPPTIPGTPDAPYWQTIKSFYFYDPVPALRSLQTPTLALWGELDNNILAEKNLAAWQAALVAGGNKDFTLRILSKANHSQWEAQTGSNAEMRSLKRFVPEYFTTITDWLAQRIRGLEASTAN